MSVTVYALVERGSTGKMRIIDYAKCGVFDSIDTLIGLVRKMREIYSSREEECRTRVVDQVDQLKDMSDAEYKEIVDSRVRHELAMADLKVMEVKPQYNNMVDEYDEITVMAFSTVPAVKMADAQYRLSREKKED